MPNTDNELQPDREMTPDQEKLAEQLSEAEVREIDHALLANASHQWRKVARIVGSTMLSELPDRLLGLPDVYYAKRVAHLVEEGILEAVGDLKRMRFSEVRLKHDKPRTVEDEEITFCCKRFEEAVCQSEIMRAEDTPDETEWYLPGAGHIYYCPFCGCFIKGEGFGTYDEDVRRAKQQPGGRV